MPEGKTAAERIYNEIQFARGEVAVQAEITGYASREYADILCKISGLYRALDIVEYHEREGAK